MQTCGSALQEGVGLVRAEHPTAFVKLNISPLKKYSVVRGEVYNVSGCLYLNNPLCYLSV